jgi:hypothetical protein
MKIIAIAIAIALCVSGCAMNSADDDWELRHPTPAGMKSITECSAADAEKICRQQLLGKNHHVVRKFLGTSQRDHGEEEYIYYPTRADGSFWILVVEFAGRGCAVDIYAKELWPLKSAPASSAN